MSKIVGLLKAANVFEKATLQQKRVILEIAGSNFFLKNKILRIEAKKPFVAVENTVAIPVWWARVRDIRTFCRTQQMDVEKLQAQLRVLQPLLEISA
jgi:hypothetical protein